MRLIDADALAMHMADWQLSASSDQYSTIEEAIGAVAGAPTIDAVPVVRCKDCKHCDPKDKKCDCGHAILWQLPRDDDWFCADGERKDDEDR